MTMGINQGDPGQGDPGQGASLPTALHATHVIEGMETQLKRIRHAAAKTSPRIDLQETAYN